MKYACKLAVTVKRIPMWHAQANALANEIFPWKWGELDAERMFSSIMEYLAAKFHLQYTIHIAVKQHRRMEKQNTNGILWSNLFAANSFPTETGDKCVSRFVCQQSITHMEWKAQTRQTLQNSIQLMLLITWEHCALSLRIHAIVIRLMSMWPNLMFKRAPYLLYCCTKNLLPMILNLLLMCEWTRKSF